MRNTGGIHFTDDLYVLAGLVDNSGYSTGIREKYQAYLITEVTLQFGSQTSEARRVRNRDLSKAENLWCWIWRRTICFRPFRKKTPR